MRFIKILRIGVCSWDFVHIPIAWIWIKMHCEWDIAPGSKLSKRVNLELFHKLGSQIVNHWQVNYPPKHKVRIKLSFVLVLSHGRDLEEEGRNETKWERKKEKMGIEGQENDKGKNYFPGDYKLWVSIQAGLQ